MFKIRTFIVVIGIFQLIFLSLLTIDVNVNNDVVGRAIVGMVWGLVLCWVVICGSLMYFFRHRIREKVIALNFHWRVKFVGIAIIAALVEEFITTGMTNLAPLFGAEIGEAYITASTNYFDVVLFHSVIVFIPMFVAWSWLISRYAFTTPQVFLLFGITGTLIEILSFGGTGILNMGLWIYVYGLMLYTSLHTLPPLHHRQDVKLQHYFWAVLLPILAAIPIAIIVNVLHPVNIHFEPIG